MNGMMLLVAVTALGVEYGWQPAADTGELEYIIQIEPQWLENGGRDLVITSRVPPEVQAVRQFRIVVGEGPVPRVFPNEASAARPNLDSGVVLASGYEELSGARPPLNALAQNTPPGNQFATPAREPAIIVPRETQPSVLSTNLGNAPGNPLRSGTSPPTGSSFTTGANPPGQFNATATQPNGAGSLPGIQSAQEALQRAANNLGQTANNFGNDLSEAAGRITQSTTQGLSQQLQNANMMPSGPRENNFTTNPTAAPTAGHVNPGGFSTPGPVNQGTQQPTSGGFNTTGALSNGGYGQPNHQLTQPQANGSFSTPVGAANQFNNQNYAQPNATQPGGQQPYVGQPNNHYGAPTNDPNQYNIAAGNLPGQPNQVPYNAAQYNPNQPASNQYTPAQYNPAYGNGGQLAPVPQQSNPQNSGYGNFVTTPQQHYAPVPSTPPTNQYAPVPAQPATNTVASGTFPVPAHPQQPAQATTTTPPATTVTAPPVAPASANPPVNTASYHPPENNGGSKKNSTLNRPDEEASQSWPLSLALFALFASIGANAYLGWIAWDNHDRCRSALSQQVRRRERAA